MMGLVGTIVASTTKGASEAAMRSMTRFRKG